MEQHQVVSGHMEISQQAVQMR